MFETDVKSKIPSFLAYPVHAKQLWEALADVPQAAGMKIWFYYSKSSTRQDADVHPVLSVEYRFSEASRFLPHSVKVGPRWSITVQPVQSAIKHHVAEMLQREAFPRLHGWLLTKKDVTGEVRSHRLSVLYNEALDRLEYREHPEG